MDESPNLDFHSGDYTQKTVNSPPQPLNGNPPSGSIWSLNFYRKYFNVDSHIILERIRLSFVPSHKLIDAVFDSPDLWGPFWMSTTLIVMLFVGSSLLQSILAVIHNKEVANYDLAKLYTAISLIYPYVFGMPLLIWIVCRYYATPTTFFALVDLYGYTICVWLPIAFLSAIPLSWLRILLIIGAFGVSGSCLALNLFALLTSSMFSQVSTRLMDKNVAMILSAVVFGVHGIFAILFGVLFFNIDIENLAKNA